MRWNGNQAAGDACGFPSASFILQGSTSKSHNPQKSNLILLKTVADLHQCTDCSCTCHRQLASSTLEVPGQRAQPISELPTSGQSSEDFGVAPVSESCTMRALSLETVHYALLSLPPTVSMRFWHACSYHACAKCFEPTPRQFAAPAIHTGEAQRVRP